MGGCLWQQCRCKFQVQLLIGNVRVCILRTTVTAREVSVRFGMRACQRWVANCTAADHGSIQPVHEAEPGSEALPSLHRRQPLALVVRG